MRDIRSELASFETASRLLESRRIEEALRYFDAAELAGFDADACAGGRWFCHMLRGDFESAWVESDDISARGAPDPNRLWSGRSLRGKKVVVRCLHGLGDAIQFIRFVPRLGAICSELQIETSACLVSLFKTVQGASKVFTWEHPPAQPFDWQEQVEVMELPRILRVQLAQVPSAVPYVFPPQAPASVTAPQGKDGLRVGLAWQASAWNTARSIPLHLLSPLLRRDKCVFYSLQLGDDFRNGVSSPEAARVIPSVPRSASVLDTAAIIGGLDLVITVDTMVAHLAGALGKPVWLLLSEPADWRWMIGRTDCPWYPSMKIFRQDHRRDWRSVIERVRLALDSFIAREPASIHATHSRPASASPLSETTR